MSIHYEVISEDNIICFKDLCNELMAYQKSKANIHPELFDSMRFETRMIRKMATIWLPFFIWSL